MSNAANAALAGPWKDLWNGDLGVTDQIIAEDFVAHAAPLTGTGPDAIRGREALKGWISGIHTVVTGKALTTVAPDADVLSELGEPVERVVRADEALPFTAIAVGASLVRADNRS